MDFNPILFYHLLNQSRLFDTKNSIHISPPSDPLLITPFKKMLQESGLNYLVSSKRNIITFNVDDPIIRNQRKTFYQISNSTFDTIVSLSKTTKCDNTSDVFLDYNQNYFDV